MILQEKIQKKNDKQNTFIAFMKKYKDNKWVWVIDDNLDLSHLITPWMPIPETPKE